jgi:hypothetical protein
MALPFTFSTQTGTIPLNELDQNFLYLENLVPALAVAAGTVITASQPNITSVGTLTGLNCSGTVTAGTVTASILNGTLSVGSQPNITEIGTLANLVVSNTVLAGTVTATTVGAPGGNLIGTVVTPAQPNITSVGTLSALAVSGSISGATISGTTITGTLTTAAQPNLTSVGTLTSLSVAGNISGSNLSANTIIGTVSTALQPNITSVGTLTSLGVSGVVTAGSLSVSGTSTLSGTVTAPTAANGTSNTQVATTAFVQNSLVTVIPSGVIVMWSGSVASIPAGWFLCNGSNGTPDLRDRFVVGAGSTYNPAATGGSANAIVVSHTHTATSSVTDPGHRHSYTAPSGTDTGGSFGSNVVDTTVSALTANAFTGIAVTTTIASAGASGTNANLPPYYALAYIMKA